MCIKFWIGWWGFRWFFRSSERLISRTVTVSSHLKKKNTFPYLSPVCSSLPLPSALPSPSLLLQLKLCENVTLPLFYFPERLAFWEWLFSCTAWHCKVSWFKACRISPNTTCHRTWNPAVDYCSTKVENPAFRVPGLNTFETRNPNADAPFDFIQETGLARGTAFFRWGQRSGQCTCSSGTTHSSWWFSWLHAQCVHQWQETGSKFSQRFCWHFWPLSSTWPVFWWSVQKWREMCGLLVWLCLWVQDRL